MMITPKDMTPEQRLKFVQEGAAKRAQSQDNSNITPTKPIQKAKPQKSKSIKPQKALGKMAMQRKEQERQEAIKSNAEKIAESLKRRSTIVGNHPSVMRQVSAVMQRNTQVKNVKLRPIKKIKQQAPMDRSSEYAIFKARIDERDKQFARLFKQAEEIRNRLEQISKRETVKFHEAFRDCYGIYEFIESSEDSYDFYENLRSYFKATLVSIQSNTPDEGLLTRFIFPRKSDDDNKRYNKRISEYGTVLRYARNTHVSKKDFIKWYVDTTQTRILSAARKSATADNKEKLERAKIVLLRYFDIREQWPLGHFDYPEFLANKQVHLPDELMFVVCRGVRKFNRDIYFDPENSDATSVSLAEISALHFIPPNISLVHDLISRLAAFLVPHIDQIEQEIDQKTEQVWADDMANILMERELGSAYKSADKWADRQQALMAEDQVAFEAKRKKIQKIRNKERK